MNLVRPIVSERDGRQVIMRFVPGGPIDALLINERAPRTPAREYQTLGLSPREAEVLVVAYYRRDERGDCRTAPRFARAL